MNKVYVALGFLTLGFASLLYFDAAGLHMAADTRGTLFMGINAAMAMLGFAVGKAKA